LGGPGSGISNHLQAEPMSKPKIKPASILITCPLQGI
jgi:hypothetical protein